MLRSREDECSELFLRGALRGKHKPRETKPERRTPADPEVVFSWQEVWRLRVPFGCSGE
jgi:hypothetical protein